MSNRRPPPRLRVTELEARTTPAWWTVSLPDPPAGTAGSTDASHAGSLTLRDEHLPENGTVMVPGASAVEAVVRALEGTISVTLASQTVSYVLGPDTVGTSAAEQKPFLAVASGSSVTLHFEDLAGFAGSDWDYNDRSWDLSSVTPLADVLAEGSYISDPVSTGETADSEFSVEMTVTKGGPDRLDWRYVLTNIRYQETDDIPEPISDFTVHFAAGSNALVTEVQNGLGWSHSLGEEWTNQSFLVSWGTGSGGLAPGASATFTFRTDNVPIDTGHVGPQHSAWGPGPLPAAGPVPATDIVINGKYGNNQAFDHNTEDTIGGLVVRRANDNNAPRQEIEIKQISPGDPWDGLVELTKSSDKVKLFTAAEGGDEVASGTKFDNKTQLPKKLYVQGEAASGAMRDVILKTRPMINNEPKEERKDEVKYTVLWVDVTLKFDGNVSGDNTAKAEYKKLTLDGSDKLGPQVFKDINDPNVSIYGHGYEAKGVVSPGTFSYPGAEVRLDRDVAAALFGRNDPQGVDEQYPNPANIPAKFRDSIPMGNDPSIVQLRDDEPAHIYDLDAPGLVLGARPAGLIWRYRFNFKEYGVLIQGGKAVRASDVKKGFVRFSIIQQEQKQPGGNLWFPLPQASVAAVPGDNTAGEGEHIKLTWNFN